LRSVSVFGSAFSTMPATCMSFVMNSMSSGMSVLRIQNDHSFSKPIMNSIPASSGRCSRYIRPRSIFASVDTTSTLTATSPLGVDR